MYLLLWYSMTAWRIDRWASLLEDVAVAVAVGDAGKLNLLSTADEAFVICLQRIRLGRVSKIFQGNPRKKNFVHT